MKKATVIFFFGLLVLSCLTSCHPEVNEPDKADDLFCITAMENGVDVSMKVYNQNNPIPSVELLYSLDKNNWHDFIVGQTVVTLNKSGDKVFLKAKTRNSAFACIIDSTDGELTYNSHNFVFSKKAKVSGNIMYLLNGDNLDAYPLESCALAALFYDSKNLVDASSLILPANKLSFSCYGMMFTYCSSLLKGPKLPALELAKDCYQTMFAGCTQLQEAPELPATQLAKRCYRIMFANCEQLVSAPALPATVLAEDCYAYMFLNCFHLMEAPILPATQLADKCYHAMFYNCNNLVQAPEMPALTTEENCYYAMFEKCTSLTQALPIHAENFKELCCARMFSGCSSLLAAPVMNPTTVGPLSCSMMFKNCSSMVNGPTLPATVLTKQCYHEMFLGCSSLKSVTCKATSLGLNSVNGWLDSVTTQGVLYAVPGIDWKDKIPATWTVEYE